MKKNQKGFAHLFIFLAALVFVLTLVIGFYVWKKNSPNHNNKAGGGRSNSSSEISDSRDDKTESKDTSAVDNQTQQPSSTIAKPKQPRGDLTHQNNVSPSPPQPSAPAKPTISIISPVNGSIVTGNSVVFKCTFSAPGGFSLLEVITYDQYGESANTGFTQGTESAGCDETMDITYLVNGQYTVTFTIYDDVGELAEASAAFTIQH